MKTKLLAVALAALALAACRATLAPIFEVQDQVVLSYSGKQATAEDVRHAILDALRARRWHLVEDAPGSLAATVASGGHRATVRITYDAGRYSIAHEDSSDGLKYSAGSGTVHRRYNHWVQRLDEAIMQTLAEL